jgi:hypothetical protein
MKTVFCELGTDFSSLIYMNCRFKRSRRSLIAEAGVRSRASPVVDNLERSLCTSGFPCQYDTTSAPYCYQKGRGQSLGTSNTDTHFRMSMNIEIQIQ